MAALFLVALKLMRTNLNYRVPGPSTFAIFQMIILFMHL